MVEPADSGDLRLQLRCHHVQLLPWLRQRHSSQICMVEWVQNWWRVKLVEEGYGAGGSPCPAPAPKISSSSPSSHFHPYIYSDTSFSSSFNSNCFKFLIKTSRINFDFGGRFEELNADITTEIFV
ncbi:hypothetical protein L1987_75783 [Smallanthus sonchifolius]|uniref:Uncharacterized protein n=1 Tax=Smallanthus sonchifolius TaxID=185202 RepID=A0ACB9A6E9_9ASTR|nr:hypothetical protein L1987_75783 [Smallanthus sonchifolius]